MSYSSLVELVSNGTVRTEFAILAFLSCEKFVKPSDEFSWYGYSLSSSLTFLFQIRETDRNLKYLFLSKRLKLLWRTCCRQLDWRCIKITRCSSIQKHLWITNPFECKIIYQNLKNHCCLIFIWKLRKKSVAKKLCNLFVMKENIFQNVLPADLFYWNFWKLRSQLSCIMPQSTFYPCTIYQNFNTLWLHIVRLSHRIQQ